MKLRSRMLGCGALVLGGCAAQGGQPEQVIVEHEDELEESWQAYRDAARRMVDGHTVYVTEWDLVFTSEAGLRRHFDAELARESDKLAVFKQISTGFENTFSFAEQLSLTYCVSGSFGSDKSAAVADMQTAARRWEAVANVNFVHVPSEDATCDLDNLDVDFAVMPASNFFFSVLFGCAANRMAWDDAMACIIPNPAGGWYTGAKGVVAVNYQAHRDATGDFDVFTPAGTLTHELGHFLGFRHEHPWAPAAGGCSEDPTEPDYDVTGRRLTAYDVESVMHYPQCDGITGVDFSLSELDGVGARVVYGMPASWYVPLAIL
jgi:serralysin